MKRHSLDLLSLLTGLVFVAVAAVYFVADVSGATPGFQVMMPLMVVGLGIAGLVAAVAAQQRSDRQATAPTESGAMLDVESDEPDSLA